MRRVVAAAFVLALVAPGLAQSALAQQPQPRERANEPLQDVIADQFADDGTHDDDAWGEEWGEDPFGEEANAEWEEGNEAAGHGGEHGESHFDLQQFFAQAVNFVLWLAIVIYLARKPLSDFLQNRRLSVEEGLVEAKNLKEAAEAKYADYSERLERLDEELEKLRTEMVQAGEAERDRIVAEAESRATRMRNDARFVIDQQLKQLRTDLTREAIEAAVTAAEQTLAAQVQEADHSRLAQEYLDGLGDSMKDDEVRA